VHRYNNTGGGKGFLLSKFASVSNYKTTSKNDSGELELEDRGVFPQTTDLEKKIQSLNQRATTPTPMTATTTKAGRILVSKGESENEEKMF